MDAAVAGPADRCRGRARGAGVVATAAAGKCLSLGQRAPDFEEELLRLLEQVEKPNFAQLYFSDDRAVDVAIEILPLDPQVLVDNDNDLVAPVSEIRLRIQAGESWRTATA